MVTNNAWNSQDPAQVAKGGTGRATITAFNVMVGNGTGQVSLVAPSATSGVPLISQGAASNPAYGTAVVAGGGTGVTSATAYAVICGGTTSTGPFQSIAGVGTAGQILTSNGAGALPTFQNNAGTSKLVQQVRAQSTTKTQFTSVTSIPADDTIPQNTEGAEVITLAITPTNASNILVFECLVNMTWDTTTNNQGAICLFQDSTADALATHWVWIVAAAMSSQIKLFFYMTAGTTSSTTFKIRCGGAGTSAFTVNGAANVRRYGGVMPLTFTISEIQV